MNTEGILGHSRQIQRLDGFLRRNQVPHCLLFHGPSGVGKKTLARRFFRSIICPDGGCGICQACLSMEEGAHPDVVELLPNDRGVIPVGDVDEEGTVRWLTARLSRKSWGGRYCVLIDGVERISPQGQNALLKLIEEPPAGTCCILLATDRSRVLPTILSRSFDIPFYPLDEGDLSAVLKVQGVAESRIGEILPCSGGSVEQALLLAGKGVWEEVMALAGAMARSVTGGVFDQDPAQLQKKMGTEELVTAMENLFRILRLARIEGRDVPESLVSLAGLGEADLVRISRIFLVLRRGLGNNLNLKLALKGMGYMPGESDPAAVYFS